MPPTRGSIRVLGLLVLRTPESAVEVLIRGRVVVGGRWHVQVSARRSQVLESEVP